MKIKIKKSSELLWIFGIIFVALGVAICSKADLGVSMIAAPAFVISEAVQSIWHGFSVGVVEYLFQGALLILMCFIIGKFRWKFLLAFLSAVIYGYVLNFFLFLFGTTPFSAVWLRYIMLLLSDVCTAFGVACFFRTYLPLQVYELFVAETAKRFSFNINRVKWTFDICLLLVSLSLALFLFGDVKTFDWSKIAGTSFHNIGAGTIITTLINSPIITLWGKLIDKIFEPAALFPKIEKALK